MSRNGNWTFFLQNCIQAYCVRLVLVIPKGFHSFVPRRQRTAVDIAISSSQVLCETVRCTTWYVVHEISKILRNILRERKLQQNTVCLKNTIVFLASNSRLVSVSGVCRLRSICSLAGAQPRGGIWSICPSRNFQNIAKQFWHLQKLSKNKDEILYSNHY